MTISARGQVFDVNKHTVEYLLQISPSSFFHFEITRKGEKKLLFAFSCRINWIDIQSDGKKVKRQSVLNDAVWSAAEPRNLI